MALTLSRKAGESIRIGNAVVTIRRMSKSRVIVDIDAPPEINIVRGELPVDPSHEPMKGKP